MGILLSGYQLGDVSLPNAYARILNSSQHSDMRYVEIVMGIWSSKTSRDANNPPLTYKHLSISNAQDVGCAFGEIEWPGTNPPGTWGENAEPPANMKEWGYWALRNLSAWNGAKE
jgi:hypothetical protein